MHMTLRFDAVAVAEMLGDGTAFTRDLPAPVPDWTVALIDRRTGAVHCVGGHPVLRRTGEPRALADTMMRNRDPRHWTVRIHPA